MSDPQDPAGINRRGFITSMGAGALGAAALAHAGNDPASAPVTDAGETVVVSLTVNGTPQRVSVAPNTTLLEVLRGHLGLTGTKPGCERGECGACTVLIGGIARYACQTLAIEIPGAEVTTVEGLLAGEELGPVQRAFVEKDGLQCGFCTPGQVMSVEGLLRKNPDPSVGEIREALAGNLCRCGAYTHIVRSARRAAELKRGGK